MAIPNSRSPLQPPRLPHEANLRTGHAEPVLRGPRPDPA